jgi:hypothetical protein
MSNRFNPHLLMAAAENLDEAMDAVPVPPNSPAGMDALDAFGDLDEFEFDDAGFRLLVAAQRSPIVPVAPVVNPINPSVAGPSVGQQGMFVRDVRDALMELANPLVAPLVPYDDSSPEDCGRFIDSDDDGVTAPPNSVEPDDVVSSSSGLSPSAYFVS